MLCIAFLLVLLKQITAVLSSCKLCQIVFPIADQDILRNNNQSLQNSAGMIFQDRHQDIDRHLKWEHTSFLSDADNQAC